ncbi:hypothetical protein GMLC_37630 [Geomonas limicola]|uniref:Metallo-beta-lactamase domain-containing protein n=1 Tax=Geomonas limicola TaxID=2740186 RepID=A0A6V8NEE6_9BACT|nr:MBL fold metallo-hydrolase [Geomonas limicola]GFO70184.1 hypothetical protein GMLC_37630 [Geomonas limicola]
MQIIPLRKSERTYSCNAYLILGDWNRIGDLNTLIDPGSDDFVLDQIERLSTGFGKVKVEQVILTHNHFDHMGGAAAVKERYGSRVIAFSAGHGVDEIIRDGQFLKAGDDLLEVIHLPGHSSDSICLFAPSNGALFCGDTQFRFRPPLDRFPPGFLEGLRRLAGKRVQSIYSGHDAPVLEQAQEQIAQALEQIERLSGSAAPLQTPHITAPAPLTGRDV